MQFSLNVPVTYALLITSAHTSLISSPHLSITGTHVRFRLGGHTFPPSIYFKIYTHRPLCDINAFAPRDYSKEKKPEGLRFNSSINNTPGTLRNTRTGNQ